MLTPHDRAGVFDGSERYAAGLGGYGLVAVTMITAKDIAPLENTDTLEKLDFQPRCSYQVRRKTSSEPVHVCDKPAYWAVYLKCGHVSFMCQSCVVRAQTRRLIHRACGQRWNLFYEGITRMEPIDK